eukprot:gb/GECH01013455.1/.p1 GENE.gb/GECH01013455.1/~~gb/GECH01013455.1/.p1  ORF type:complete len:334 (+),score=51.79 gb/GECH01013455.1/:1-1002(+)
MSTSEDTAGMLSAAFSQMLGGTVHITPNTDSVNKSNENHIQWKNIDSFHSGFLVSTSLPSALSSSSHPNEDDESDRKGCRGLIYVKTMTDETLTFKTNDGTTLLDLKKEIRDREGIPIDQQRLIFHAKQLSPEFRTLKHFNIKHGSTLHFVLRLRGGGIQKFLLDPNNLDPNFDYDFTYVKDEDIHFKRGGESYQRPLGWKRFAIRVKGKYGSDEWLGKKGYRTSSSGGEWPVSYHGTKSPNASNIVKQGYRLSKSHRFLYGRGIYSTPDPDVAALYAQRFDWKGQEFQMIFQNRVNPEKLEKIPSSKTNVGEYWISTEEEAIRPYGVCIRRV